jgi:hypothetical protein
MNFLVRVKSELTSETRNAFKHATHSEKHNMRKRQLSSKFERLVINERVELSSNSLLARRRAAKGYYLYGPTSQKKKLRTFRAQLTDSIGL